MQIVRIFSVVILLVFGAIFNMCSSGMENLPEGELIETVYSPDETYKINSYLVSGNATTAFSVRCEVIEIATEKVRNIYWNYRCERAEIEWLDNINVRINGVDLNVQTDSYDWRKAE